MPEERRWCTPIAKKPVVHRIMLLAGLQHLLFCVQVSMGFAAYRYCGSEQDLTVDHVKPVSKGGLWEWSNLVTACNKCNGKKGSKTLKQLGWKLHKIPSVCMSLSTS